MVVAADVLPIDQVEFVKELYPRLREDEAAIERYRTAVDLLPPIAVARGRILVDGFHRWQAHRRERRPTIAVIDLGNLADIEIRRESIIRNATHGQQLSQADKRRLAGVLWRDFAAMRNGDRMAEIESLLSVSRRAIESWTQDARAIEKAEQQDRAWDLWLDCLSERQVAAQVGLDDATAHRYIASKAQECGNEAPESRQHFDIWEFHRPDGESGFFGRLAPQIVENLLWLYTEPGQIVMDPFAGGATTIDVAKRMGRRVWASDLHPSTPTRPIHQWDITQGWPDGAPNKVDFLLLDPPYWQQAAGRYSDDSCDLGNMTLDEFRQAWRRVLAACVPHMRSGGHVAFIVSPSFDGDRVIDHAFEMRQAADDAGLELRRRVIAPYSVMQANGQEVTWAREQRRLLLRYRDLQVMRCP